MTKKLLHFFITISFFRNLLFILIFLLIGLPSNSQQINSITTRILIIFDASGSMNAQFEESDRMTAAKSLLNKLVDSLSSFSNIELGLRVFGHQSNLSLVDCDDTKLEIPFSKYNHEIIKKSVAQLKPRGYTPIARSLAKSAGDFPKESDKNIRNLIIMITDGIEECGGNPCEVSQELQKKGIFLKPFIIGIGSNPEVFKKFFSCVGEYYDANSTAEIDNVVGVVVSQAMNATSCQINLLDNNGRPMETNVNMTIYDANTNLELFNYYHTLNGKGLPDTLYLDPIRKYNIKVHTLPIIYKSNISIIPGKHNIIALDAGQGDLNLIVEGNTKYDKLQAIIRTSGNLNTIHAQEFNSTKRYLVGLYDIEILSTPRIVLNNVRVSQDKTTKVNIPQPGIVKLTRTKEYVSAIFRIYEGKTEWVVDIDERFVSQEIVMQPGNYFIIGRLKSETKTIYTFQKEFTINSAKVTDLKY
jgi:Ca-activated chloride channel family protein